MSRMEDSEKRRIVEALILSSTEPISAARLADVIPYCNEGQAKDLVNELNTEYVEQDRSFEIWEVAGGFQIRTRAEFSGYLQKLQKERALRLSQAALETLAIIAYRQPTTRAEIEDVRGVDAGATVKSLLERHLIRIAGQREVPGRPMVYATTRRFLEVFGLERLKDLPTLRELDELAREQGLLEKAGEGADVIHEGSAARALVEGAEVDSAQNITDGVFAPDAAAVSNSLEVVLDHEDEGRKAGETDGLEASEEVGESTLEDSSANPEAVAMVEDTDDEPHVEAGDDSQTTEEISQTDGEPVAEDESPENDELEI